MQFDLNIDLFFKKDLSALEGQSVQAAATIRPTERPELPVAEWLSHKLYASAMLSNTGFSGLFQCISEDISILNHIPKPNYFKRVHFKHTEKCWFIFNINNV